MSDEYEQDYFVYFPPPCSSTFPYPRLEWGETNSYPFSQGPVPLDSYTLVLVEWFLVPLKRQYPDCFKLGGKWPVVSERVSQVLESLQLYGLDLHPAYIITRKREVLYGYQLVHVWNKLSCIDRERSRADWCQFPPNRIREPFDVRYSKSANTTRRGDAQWDNMALRFDRNVMEQIPLERRLVFSLEELSPFIVFHRSVVEKIMAIQPTGITFAPFAMANFEWIWREPLLKDTPFPPVLPENPELLRKPPTLANLRAAARGARKASRSNTPATASQPDTQSDE